jgi:hypothetical protein
MDFISFTVYELGRSGLGFSNSMPESVIRENLELSEIDNSAAGGSATKRQNLAIFPGLVNY